MWQPIETAPKDGTSILVLADGFAPSVARWRAEMWMTADMEGEYEDGELRNWEWNLTYWQPLPELP